MTPEEIVEREMKKWNWAFNKDALDYGLAVARAVVERDAQIALAEAAFYGPHVATRIRGEKDAADEIPFA